MQLRFGGFFITLRWLVEDGVRGLVITLGSLLKGGVRPSSPVARQAAQETSPASGHVEARQAAASARIRRPPSQPVEEPRPHLCGPFLNGVQAAQETSSASGLVEARAIDRVYCVWFVPDAPEACGVWVGPHPETWSAICAFLRGGTYPGSRAHLRRYPSLAAAQAAWIPEAPRKHRPTAAPPVIDLRRSEGAGEDANWYTVG